MIGKINQGVFADYFQLINKPADKTAKAQKRTARMGSSY